MQDEGGDCVPASCVGGGEIRTKTELFHTFITEQAAPVPLAVALPGVDAGPVDAARINQTFVTQRAHPAVITTVKHKT